MKIFSFEKLNVWQKARNLSVKIYKTTKAFPDDERFGLISQMRRCSVSISSNIAKGTGRHSPKDKARFTEIAYSSCLELLNQAILSSDLEFIANDDYRSIRNDGNNRNARCLAQITAKGYLEVQANPLNS